VRRRAHADLAHLAEEAGWDGVFLEDYIVWQGHADVPTYDPWVALAAMALSTQRVRLGIMVTPLLCDRHPEAIEMLKQAFQRDDAERIYAQTDDLLDPLRGLSEFQELMQAAL
jgi:hypothetical protein